MSNLLREGLRTLCGVNQWSYAVFWKIGCHNPKLLIWEECYIGPVSSLVPPSNSGAESSDLPVGYWPRSWGSDVCSSLGIQARDRVHLLINRMMISNHVNVVGEGLVGRAAFTGNHDWILASISNGGVHPPEVSNEVHHQFSAGIQTVAVVPVFPHGVVQFGSLLPIMENMGFVNNVKSLILQLGCVPGVLLSDNYSARVGVPVSRGTPIPVQLINPAPLLINGSSQLSFSSQTSRSVVQPCHSQCEQPRDNAQLAASAFHIPSMTNNLTKSHDGYSEMESTAMMKPGDLFKGNLQDGVVGAQVIPSNPNMWLNQHAASQNSRPGFCHQPVVGQSDGNDSIPKLLQQQILSDAVLQNRVCDNKDALQRFTMPHMMTNGNPPLSSHEVSLTSGTELLNRISGHTRLSSIPCSLSNSQNMVDVNHFSAYPARLGPQSFLPSKADEVPSSTLVDQVSGRGMLLASSDDKNIYPNMRHSKHELIASKERMDKDPFQAFNSKLSSQQDECMTFSEHNPSSLRDCLDQESGIRGTITANVKYEGSLAQPVSGDDLYDILGMDFKNKFLSGKWNNVLEDGPYKKAQIKVKDTSTFMNMKEVNQDVYSVNEAISVSGIFSATDTDDLLDAVVSGAHIAAKQSLDDTVSCRTTLMKTNSSSVPNDSLAHGHVNVSDQRRKGLFGLPKLQQKVGTEASCSIISGCMKDGTKSCSQSPSMCGSQLSSWVEQANNVRCESSAVTAFSKKNDEVSKPYRKRLKPGENPRPRPKDRQMIQDRVKELREIVPNGAKCSIDALLERTIKHMLFLQSVTKQADKLKQTGESKIINKEGGDFLKDNFEAGATWAYKVGSQSMVCPIIVEDLNPPRQMLVEMLCEEHGFFLEIADLIRGVGLTILRGVMEAQNDKIWARFAVEANRDITRMEIFMSLVHLLEQTMKGTPSAVNALEKNNSMIHLAFPQTASIPVTGRPSKLL